MITVGKQSKRKEKMGMRYKTSFTLEDATRKQIAAIQASLQLEKEKTITKSEVVEVAIKEYYEKKVSKK